MSYIIYKITNLDDGKCYIGSTTKTLEQRVRKHILGSIGNYNSCSCKDFNWDNIETEELEKSVDLDNRYKRERYFIQNTDNVVNKKLPYLTEDERIEYARVRSYNEYRRYRKPLMLGKVRCECGVDVCRASYKRHLSSLLHLKRTLEM